MLRFRWVCRQIEAIFEVSDKIILLLSFESKKTLQMLIFLSLNCLRSTAFFGRRLPSACDGRPWHNRGNIWLGRSERESLPHIRRSGASPSDAGFPVPDPVSLAERRNGNACRSSCRKWLGDKHHPTGGIRPLRSCSISSQAAGRCVPVWGSGETAHRLAFAP